MFWKPIPAYSSSSSLPPDMWDLTSISALQGRGLRPRELKGTAQRARFRRWWSQSPTHAAAHSCKRCRLPCSEARAPESRHRRAGSPGGWSPASSPSQLALAALTSWGAWGCWRRGLCPRAAWARLPAPPAACRHPRSSGCRPTSCSP